MGLPANTEARLLSVKSALADGIRTQVEFERFLKFHGFANSLARRLARAWKDAVGRRDDDEAQELIIAALRQSTARLKG